MKIPEKIDKNRLILGGIAAACALVLPSHSRLRTAAYAAAALGVGSAFTKRDSEDVAEDLPKAPELVKSAMVDGILMRWEEHGSNEPDAIPVIMVHGIPTQPRLWRYVIAQLSQAGVRCLAWEQVGFGWSMEQGLDRDISVARQADYLYDWLQHLGIRQAVFVGHDVGGGVVQQLLVKHPDLCRGLVLADCVAYDNWPVAAVRAAQKQTALIGKLPPALLKPIFLTGLANLGHDQAGRRKESAELHWQPYSRAIGPKAFAHQLDNLSAKDTEALGGKLSAIGGVKRVVWSDADPLEFATGQRLAEELGAPLTRIPGGRHFSPEDHPDVIARVINEVISQLGSGAESVVGSGV
jgi:pimeloyl-ACP methyl ester carboxylesterase